MSEEPLEEDRALLAERVGLNTCACGHVIHRHYSVGCESCDCVLDEKSALHAQVAELAARVAVLSAAHRRCEATLERWELCPPDRTRALTELTLSIVDDVRAALAPATGVVSKRDGD